MRIRSLQFNNNGEVMLVEKDLQKLFSKLTVDTAFHYDVEGFDVFLRALDQGTKLSLSTRVYFGGNFIPRSVRRCLSEKVPFPSHIKTSFTVDEENYQIILNYIGYLSSLSRHEFREVFEEFLESANFWRDYLDEHDKHDLLHVRVQ